jgi:hypothetical protein
MKDYNQLRREVLDIPEKDWDKMSEFEKNDEEKRQATGIDKSNWCKLSPHDKFIKLKKYGIDEYTLKDIMRNRISDFIKVKKLVKNNCNDFNSL